MVKSSDCSQEEAKETFENEIGAEEVVFEEKMKPTENLDGPILVQIDMILTSVQDLEKQIDGFQSHKDSKEYKTIDEMLTRNLLALDKIDSNGSEIVRRKRKESVEIIENCLRNLELRAAANQVCKYDFNCCLKLKKVDL